MIKHKRELTWFIAILLLIVIGITGCQYNRAMPMHFYSLDGWTGYFIVTPEEDIYLHMSNADDKTVALFLIDDRGELVPANTPVNNTTRTLPVLVEGKLSFPIP